MIKQYSLFFVPSSRQRPCSAFLIPYLLSFILIVGCKVEPNAYTVTFLAGEGTPTIQTRAVNDSDALGSAMPTDPSWSGYSFNGWYTRQSGNGTKLTATTRITTDSTVYAYWTVDTSVLQTVTFGADGGTPDVQTKKVEKGSSLNDSASMPTEPSKTGFAFDGWYTEKNGGGTAFTATTLVTANMTVYAKWASSTLVPATTLLGALTWLEANAKQGGTYIITLSADESIGPKTLSYNGNNVNIHIQGGNTGRVVSSQGGNTERVVSLLSPGALFTVGTGVTLTLDSNISLRGRSDNTVALVQVSVGGALVMETGSKISGNTASGYGGGGAVSVNSGTFTMSGGTISGNTASIAGGGVYAKGTFIKQTGGTIYGSNAEDTLKNIAGSGDLYGHAVYIESSPIKKRNSTAGESVVMDSSLNGATGGWVDTDSLKTVTFNTDGGSPVSLAKQVNSGASVEAMPAIPSKTNYNFDGWYTEKNGGGTEFTATTVVTANITVYANWTTDQYKVTFDPDEGSCDTQFIIENKGDTVDEGNMPTPTKEHHAFDGWYTAKNGGGSAFTTLTPVIANVTVYAKWTVVQYTVTFDPDGGNPVSQMSVNGGTQVGSLPSAKWNSNFFDGWYTQKNGGGTEFTATTPVTADITVYAKWVPNIPMQITLRPIPNDPSIKQNVINVFQGQEATFSVDKDPDIEFLTYKWYWNDQLQSETDTYTLAPNTNQHGSYKLSVVVTTNTREQLSAQCEVLIKESAQM
jgi:uncharacterized repeat protein (TIGR02543 family)